MPVVRAGIDVSTGVRPGGLVESDKLPSDVRKRAMEAVDACGGRVTIGDVASRAGLKLNEAQKALQALAADTNGFLEVIALSFLWVLCLIVMYLCNASVYVYVLNLWYELLGFSVCEKFLVGHWN